MATADSNHLRESSLNRTDFCRPTAPRKALSIRLSGPFKIDRKVHGVPRQADRVAMKSSSPTRSTCFEEARLHHYLADVLIAISGTARSRGRDHLCTGTVCQDGAAAVDNLSVDR